MTSVVPAAFDLADGTTRPEIDLVDGRTYAAPELHDALLWMRRYEPFHHDTANDLWAVTRHADIMSVSKDSDSFRNGKGYRPDAPPVPHMRLDDESPRARRRRSGRRPVVLPSSQRLAAGTSPFRARSASPRKRAIAVARARKG